MGPTGILSASLSCIPSKTLGPSRPARKYRLKEKLVFQSLGTFLASVVHPALTEVGGRLKMWMVSCCLQGSSEGEGAFTKALLPFAQRKGR